MAGTLTIGTLSDGTNSTSSTNAIMGSAKAWVNFNGVTTVSVRASYNISSVTRIATGTYTFAFSSALPSSSYGIIGTASKPKGNNDTTTAMYVVEDSLPTTSGFQMQNVNANYATSTASDAVWISVAVYQ